jgi:hypothetical protein
MLIKMSRKNILVKNKVKAGAKSVNLRSTSLPPPAPPPKVGRVRMRIWKLMFDIEIGEVYSVNQEMDIGRRYL